MLNKVELIGRLTEDPKSGGSPPNNYAFITVAVNSHYKDKESGERRVKSEFIPVSLFGNIASLVTNYCAKGTKIYLEGCITIRNINSNGLRMVKTEIHGRNVIFLDKLPERDDLPEED